MKPGGVLVALALSAAGCGLVSGLDGLAFDGAATGGDGGGGGAHTASGSSGTSSGGGSSTASTASSSSTSSSGGGDSCSDGVLDGQETDVDCGGPCSPCALGLTCVGDVDCAAGRCSLPLGRCDAPVGVWEQKSPATVPNARALPTMGWDGTVVRLLQGQEAGGVIGGANEYLWNGADWTKLPTSPTAFPRRLGGAVATLGAGIAVFGGKGNAGVLQDLWSVSNGFASWAETTSAGAVPPARFGAVLAGTSQVDLVLFGGTTDAAAAFGDTWFFNGATWTQQVGSATPSPRWLAAAAYDQDAAVIVLVGGWDGASTLADIWQHIASGWTQLSPLGEAPSPRLGAVLVPVARRHRLVLVGGGEPAAPATDTWEWDGARWTRTSTTAPPALSPGAAYDPLRGRLLLMGGTSNLQTFATISAATFEYHARGDACDADADCDTGHCVDHLCCELPVCGTCEACNTPSAPGVCTPVMGGADPDSCAGVCDDSGICG